jgi:drug/metabolite transporter (DMT)-like permease
VLAGAVALALGSAFLHALWNVLLARERDPEPATAIAILASVVVFAPVAALRWHVEIQVWPFIGVTSLLQLLYFSLLAAAYRHAELSFVYPVARGLAPALVLMAGFVLLGEGATAQQAVGVLFVGLGILLVRGLGPVSGPRGGILAVAIASSIAAYTLVDKSGVQYADPVVYLELATLPTALGAVLLASVLPSGRARVRAAVGLNPVVAGVVSFGAYVLVLAALQRAPAASVAALRETSTLIVVAVAGRMLGDRVGPARLVGAAVVVSGVALIVFH